MNEMQKQEHHQFRNSIQWAIHALRDRAQILSDEIDAGTHQYGCDDRANMARERCLMHADCLEKNLKKLK